jgi:hypothetical protein
MQLDQGTQSIIAGALYDFVGHLTTLDRNLVVGSSKSPTSALDELVKWAHQRGLTLNPAQVQDWNTQPGEVTLQMVASSGVVQQERVAGAVRDFAQWAQDQGGRDWEGLLKRFAMHKQLSVANPQPHWNYRQWL